MMHDPMERGLLSRIAWAYYVEGMTQSDVANWLGISRVRVNRLLQVCRDEGYVQILVNADRAVCYELERSMEAAFGLRRAVVIPTPPRRNRSTAILATPPPSTFPGCCAMVPRWALAGAPPLPPPPPPCRASPPRGLPWFRCMAACPTAW